jgi:hypothetical protein
MSASLVVAGTAPEPRASVLGDEAPWRSGELVRVVAVAAVGLVGMGVAWYGASGQADWPDILPWASLGAAAATVAVLAFVAWLMAALRRVRSLRQELMPRLEAAVVARSAVAAAPLASGAEFVAAPGMTRFHRPDCPLAVGKPVRPLTPDETRVAGLGPCGVCCP